MFLQARVLMRYRLLAIYTNYPLGGNLVHKQINCTQIKGVQKLHRLKSQPVFSEASQMEWWEPLPWGGGGGRRKGVGMLVGNLNLTPKGDQSGRGPTFF